MHGQTEYYSLTHHNLPPPTTEEVNVIVCDVCLSDCLLARHFSVAVI